MVKQIALGALAFLLWFALFFAGKALIANGIGHNRPFVFFFALVLLAAYYAVVRWVERREPVEIAANRAWLALAGAAAGVLLFACVLGILAISGAYHFAGFAPPAALLGGAIASFAAAIGEELLFRGFIYRWIENGAGTWIAIAVSGLIFGLAHAINRGATLVDVSAIAVEAGVLLAAAYAFSRSLWLPIGIHFGWDFAGGGLFAAHGIETTPAAIVTCLLLAIVMLAGAQRMGRIKAPRWISPRTG
jgi:membrane protease YdiL (CAAX protease family)